MSPVPPRRNVLLEYDLQNHTMKHTLILSLACVLQFTMRAADKPVTGAANPAESTQSGGAKANAYTNEGVWKPIAAVLGGVPLSPPDLKAITLRITGGNYEVTVEGEKERDEGTQFYLVGYRRQKE